MYRSLLLIILPGFIIGSCYAQRDTTKKQSITITSSFRPVLRNAAKINFSGSLLNPDTSKPLRAYSVPSQNLFYAYKAVATKPLFLEQDSNLYLGTRNFLRAGIGNYTTPVIGLGLGFGDGKKFLANGYGDLTRSKGRIKNQDYSLLRLKASGSYFMKHNEAYVSAGTSRREYFLYGYDHNLGDPKREDIKNLFQEFDVTAGFRNTSGNDYQVSYSPSVKADLFSNHNRLNETTLIIDLPVQKKAGDNFTIKLDAKADLTNYSSTGLNPFDYSYSNNLGEIAPSIVYNSDRLIINGGVTPVWSNGDFTYLPNVYAEAQLKEKVFMLQSGWIGRIIKNTYRNLTEINPYLAPLGSQTNTTETEFYGGIKASLGKHFNFNAKAGIVHYKDFALFINDTSASGIYNNSFKISNERKMQNFRVRGDLSFINQEKFTANANLTLNAYTGLDDNARAWNTLPMEFTGTLRWWAFEQLLLKSDIYLFGGGHYLEAGNISQPFSGGSDVSAGAEYKINKQFSAFLDVNNIFDNRYERWHKYEVYGFNVLGGIVIRF